MPLLRKKENQPDKRHLLQKAREILLSGNLPLAFEGVRNFTAIWVKMRSLQRQGKDYQKCLTT
ncbi:MAG: hypothetical protein ACPLPS_04290 [bacterium]